MQQPVATNETTLEPGTRKSAGSAGKGSDLIASTLAILAQLRGESASPADSSRIRRVTKAFEQIVRSRRATEQRFRVLLDAVPDAVTIHDLDGRILEANAAACRIYGYSREQLLNLHLTDLNPSLPPDHIARVWPTFGLGGTDIIETNNRRANGEVFPIEVHSNAFVDNGQRRVVAVARDISARELSDHALHEARARYQVLLDAMDKGVMVHNADGSLESANPAACRLLGANERELGTMQAGAEQRWSFIDADNHPVDLAHLPHRLALRDGRPIDDTMFGVYLPQQHAYRWLSFTAVPRFEPGSKHPVQAITMFSDVSALKRESAMFRTTQQLAQIGCWEIDDLRGVVFWTDYTYRIHDLTPGSPITESRMLAFLDAGSRSRLSKALDRTRHDGRNFELELQITSNIGRRRWIYLRGQPMLRHGRIFGIVGTVQNIDEQKSTEQELRRKAATDPLTGLANRNTILERIDSAIQTRSRDDFGPVLLYIDLDRFKVLNDILGHAGGDNLMVAAARRLQDCVIGDAELARFGNDEFVVLLAAPAANDQARQLAERVVAAFGEPFAQDDGDKFVLTTSIGIARCPADGSNAQELVRNADLAMAEAKRRGRSCWCQFEEIGNADRGRFPQIEAQLRLALEHDELHLVFQPQVRLPDCSLVGVEALLRWNSEQFGPIPPTAFIPQAEATGDIVRIGAWVIDQACRQLRQWRDIGLGIDHVAVNVSYRQLLSGTLIPTVEKALAEYALDGPMLELEMTERVMIENVEDTVETFHKLHALGVRLLIDDFGEGYSSLNYLRNLPLDGIKISHTFMQGIPGQPTDAAICDAIVRIARSLDLAVVAEGVENQQQREFLMRLGTPLAQGFLFARPMGPDEMAAWAINRQSDPTNAQAPH